MNPPRRIAQKWNAAASCLAGFALLLSIGSTSLFAVGRSANYSVPCDVFDAGGAHAESDSYSHDGSLGGMIGSSASPSYTLGAGFLVQTVGVTESSPASLSILQQPVDVKIVRGSAAFLMLSTTANESDAVQTSYTLVGTTNDGVTAPAGVQGIVPRSGLLRLPLQALSDSSLSYAVQFSRAYPDGRTSTVQTRSFTVALRAWPEAAGTYTTLLNDANSSGTLPDGASARGMLTLTVSRTGAVSGRIVYLEAAVVPGAPGAGMRYYLPATRSFVGRLLPSATDPSKLVCFFKLGLGTQANRQALDLKLDFLADQPALSATVTDNISVRPGVCVSRAEGCVPSSVVVPQGVAGRYVLSANPGAADGAYTLLGVLASGRILWTTRLPGYTGSGSGGLVTQNAAKLTAPFFESRLLMGDSLLNFTALAGGLSWTLLADSSWRAAFNLGAVSDKVEKQSSYLSGTKVAGVFTPNYTDEFHSTGVELLDFSEQNYCRWSSTAIATLFPASTACLLTVKDTLTDSAAAGFTWAVTVSSGGAVKAIGIPVGGVYPPNLVLRLNRSLGGWSGYYSSDKVRRTLVGAALNLQKTRGSGWVEKGTQVAPSTARWDLSLQ